MVDIKKKQKRNRDRKEEARLGGGGALKDKVTQEKEKLITFQGK